MGTARDEFLRRYATSPIHVARLERLLRVYEDDDEDDTFCRKFISWDRACPDAEAARIVTEIVSARLDASDARLTDNALQGAIRWMADAASYSVAERARILGVGISSRDETSRRQFIEFLETSSALGEGDYRVAARFQGSRCATADDTREARRENIPT